MAPRTQTMARFSDDQLLGIDALGLQLANERADGARFVRGRNVNVSEVVRFLVDFGLNRPKEVLFSDGGATTPAAAKGPAT